MPNISFENAALFKYIGTTAAEENYCLEEVKSERNLGTDCYISVQNYCLEPKNEMDEAIILSVILCGCEIWSLIFRDLRYLRTGCRGIYLDLRVRGWPEAGYNYVTLSSIISCTLFLFWRFYKFYLKKCRFYALLVRISECVVITLYICLAGHCICLVVANTHDVSGADYSHLLFVLYHTITTEVILAPETSRV